MNIQLIPEIKQAYKYASVWLSAAVTIVAGLQAYMPELMTFLPPIWIPYAVGAIGIARVIKFSMTTVGAKNANGS